MTAFFVTIATTVTIYLLFAGFGRWGVQTSWAITLNYFVAAGLGWTLAGGMPAMGDALGSSMDLASCGIGAGLLPTLPAHSQMLSGARCLCRHGVDQVVHGHSRVGVCCARRLVRPRVGTMAWVGPRLPRRVALCHGWRFRTHKAKVA